MPFFYPVMEHQIRKEYSIKSEYRTGSSGAYAFRVHCQAGKSRKQSCQKICAYKSPSADKLFQEYSDIQQCVHIHKNMNHSYMNEITGNGPPPVTGKCNGTEIRSPFYDGYSCGSKQTHSAYRHDDK